MKDTEYKRRVSLIKDLFEEARRTNAEGRADLAAQLLESAMGNKKRNDVHKHRIEKLKVELSDREDALLKKHGTCNDYWHMEQNKLDEQFFRELGRETNYMKSSQNRQYSSLKELK